MKLIEAIPTKYSSNFQNFKSYRYRFDDVQEVIEDLPWPKKDARPNIIMWFKLSNGRIVGINKSPEGDISFPTNDFSNLRKPTKSTMMKPKKKKKKGSPYIRVGTLTPPEFFAIKEPSVIMFDHIATMKSHRYDNFRKNGVECLHCGLKGEFFALEKDRCNKKSNKAHFNLYGYNADGVEVMLTKDHIMPKSKGGANHIDNYQVLCSKCNTKKGAIIPK